MNESSASYYIYIFKKIMNGEQYMRTHNIEATGYSFSNILHDYGTAKLRNSLDAARKHVSYYENLDKGELRGVRSVISEYEEMEVQYR